MKRLLVIGLGCLLLSSAARAQEGVAPVVMELFSSQACVFCPRADRLFADLAQQKNIIALSCHVDYFDVKTGSLAQPFCTARQSWYEEALRAGPHYTPQLIFQGARHVVGYKMDDVAAALKEAETRPPAALTIEAAPDEAGVYIVTAPEGVDLTRDGLGTSMILYDKPHELTVADGRNKGQHMDYVNIASKLQGAGPWERRTLKVKPEAGEGHQGFVILAQDKRSGRVVAAGKFEFVQP